MQNEYGMRSGVRGGQDTRWLPGVLLIMVGLTAMAGQLMDLSGRGYLIMVAIGAAFLVAGLASRQAGLLVPAGILLGLGFGVYLVDRPLAGLSGEAKGGVILLSFALGWFSIAALSALFTSCAHWWALIPGGIMTLIGGSLLATEPALAGLTRVTQYAFPMGLIAVGTALILTRMTRERL
jgi:hypothetical protein